MTRHALSWARARGSFSRAWGLLAVAMAIGAVAIADVLAPTGVLVVAVFALAILGVTALYLRGGEVGKGLPTESDTRPGGRRVLLLVDGRSGDFSLLRFRQQADRVLVVGLASCSTRKRWFERDPARARAQTELDDTVARLRALQVDAKGVIAEDPFIALDDALRTFGGDELVVASRDPELIRRLRSRYAIPVAPASAS